MAYININKIVFSSLACSLLERFNQNQIKDIKNKKDNVVY